MDQKRVIVIVVVAIVVVFGIVGIAFWQFLPKTDRTVAAAYPNDPKPSPSPLSSGNPLTFQPTASPVPGTSGITNSNDVVVIVGNNNNPPYSSDASRRIPVGPASSNNPTVIVVSPAPTDQPRATPASSRAPATNRPVATKKPSSVPVVKTPSKEYWIQVIASSSRDTVESVKKDLASKGWSGRVSVTSVNKVDWYRLRYGPFENAPEANKFLVWVKQSPGLNGSFLVEENPGKN